MRVHLVVASVLLVLLSGCGPQKGGRAPSVSEPLPPVKVAGLPSVSHGDEGPLIVTEQTQIRTEVLTAIQELRQPKEMDISAIEWSQTPELDTKNLYYAIVGEMQELRYAYDISVQVKDDSLLCQIFYMPYKTGAYPEGREYISVSAFEELIAVAEEHLGTEPVSVQFTDSTWTPNQINNALEQVGGGYVTCSLSQDGTEIIYTPAIGMEMEECLSALGEVELLADELLLKLVSEDMTEMEKAFSIYSHLTENVQYDQRYYEDLEHMPYASRTALGALRDHVAICGGYSNAVNVLFKKAGISCYNVNGEYFQESHMWNIAYLEGVWRWFDATTDRGNSGEYGFLRFALEDLDTTKYRWDDDSINMLLV